MSRAATSWAYGAGGSKVLELGLTANELAVLRVLCWKYYEKNHRTDPVTNKELARLSGVRSGATLNNIRKRLHKLELIGYARANEATKYTRGDDKETSIAYVYSVWSKRDDPWGIY